MATSVLWHGTQTEALELLQALSRNCSCVVTAEGVRLSTCPPHEMLSSDQRAIDGLLFGRRIAPRLRTEEFSKTTTQPPTTTATEVGARF
jgi:hypothetical protein